METVHSIIRQTQGGYLAKCSFFLPVTEGKSPKAAWIDTNKAQRLVPGVVSGLVRVRESTRARYEPLEAKTIETILSILVAFGNIRPRGSAVIAYKNPNELIAKLPPSANR